MDNMQTPSAFMDDEKVYNKTANPVPKPEREIGIDLHDVFLDNIINAGVSSNLDISALEQFTYVSQNRDQIYSMIDTMSQDSLVSAILETYAEDATEYNDNGKIVWSESTDEDVNKYINYLLDTMNVDKNIYKWVHSLIKYGDLYIKLYRQSESEDLLFASDEEVKKALNEDVNIKAFSKNDKYTHYVEMVPNPAEMYELIKFGKTYGYVKANIRNNLIKHDNMQSSFLKYAFKKSEVDVYPATEFVHAALEDNTSRTPEEVDIFLDNVEGKESTNLNYTVKRGQSILYSVFKIWRELNLLENSVLLNRITKSSIVRLIGVEVGDMPKESVGPHLNGIKQLIEQKTALNEGISLNEYTNPGPVENNVYVPTRNGVGAISTQQVGGDVDIKSLADLDYFKNKFYGAMRIPKQYFGDTDDGAGFNGGQSLSIISSRYAKAIKRIQNTICQAITDIINLMLIDKGLDNHVNRFEIHMLPPTTQEEIDRRDNLSSKVQIVSDIINLTSDIEDPVTKLAILKSLLSSVITDVEVIQIIQDYIDKLEEEANQEEIPEEPMEGEEGADSMGGLGGPGGGIQDALGGDLGVDDSEMGDEMEATGEEETGNEDDSETMLPSPDELGLDMTDNDTDL